MNDHNTNVNEPFFLSKTSIFNIFANTTVAKLIRQYIYDKKIYSHSTFLYNILILFSANSRTEY